jgi:hypothetical protein
MTVVGLGAGDSGPPPAKASRPEISQRTLAMSLAALHPLLLN